MNIFKSALEFLKNTFNKTTNFFKNFDFKEFLNKTKTLVTSKKFAKSSLSVYLLVLSIVLVTVIVNAIAFSYSWFNPDTFATFNGGTLEYQGDTIAMRNEDCSVEYFYATAKQSDGSIEYNNAFTSELTVPSNSTRYFKAVITNSNEDIGPNVSLYISQLNASGKIISLACTYPSNTYKTYTDNLTDVPIMRNAYVKPYVKSEANPGMVEVEFFINNKSGTDFSFDPGTMYLSYN